MGGENSKVDSVARKKECLNVLLCYEEGMVSFFDNLFAGEDITKLIDGAKVDGKNVRLYVNDILKKENMSVIMKYGLLTLNEKLI